MSNQAQDMMKWNLIPAVLGLVLTLTLFVVTMIGMLEIHYWRHPEASLQSMTEVRKIWIGLPLFFSAMPPAFLIGNWISAQSSAIFKKIEEEVKVAGYPNYERSQAIIWKITRKYCPFGLLVSCGVAVF